MGIIDFFATGGTDSSATMAQLDSATKRNEAIMRSVTNMTPDSIHSWHSRFKKWQSDSVNNPDLEGVIKRSSTPQSETMGWIAIVCTFGLAFVLAYERFFCQDEHRNRKIVYKWLLDNPDAPVFYDHGTAQIKTPTYTIYWREDSQAVSLHGNNDSTCYICSASFDLNGRRWKRKLSKLFVKHAMEQGVDLQAGEHPGWMV